MKMLRAFIRDRAGGPAAEFALVLPLALLFLFGIIDVGRFMWEVNRAEKATQTGARWAVATDMIATDLAEYSFAIDGGIIQGDIIPPDAFPGVTCGNSGNCTCADDGTCDFGLTRDADAFDLLVGRMDDIKPDIGGDNVTVTYAYSGLGYAGDPNGSDVSPLVTVTVEDLDFTPLLGTFFGLSFNLPDLSYSLTLEDGQGDWSN
jgi:TadE-like protein